MSTSEFPVVYRQLGKSGLRVSVPIIGAMSFGDKAWGKWVIEEDEATLLLKAAWDRGVNTIDTADTYSAGASEIIIGNFMKKYSIPRNKIVLLTKCFFTVGETPATDTFGPDLGKWHKDYVNQDGLSRAAIFNAVEGSLARLQTSYIDLYQIHRHDPDVPPEETMKALHDLVSQGKVRYIGASSMRAWQFAEYNEVARRHGWTEFVSMQNEYSLLYREDERELLPYCKRHGIGIIPWSPLAMGFLARPWNRESSTTRIDSSKGTTFEFGDGLGDEANDEIIVNAVEALAKTKDTTMAHVALAWVMRSVVSPIVGVSSVKRLEDAIIGDTKLSDAEAELLQKPYRPRLVRNHY